MTDATDYSHSFRPGRAATRGRMHWGKIRRQGLVKVVASDARRSRAALRRYAWQAVHDNAPNAVPVYVVGIQRSGTDMLIEAFSQSPEAEIHNESIDSRAFSNWQLRSDDVIRSIIESSRARCVVFKPLCDSHRVEHLTSGLGTPSTGRAIWIFRSMEGRARSVLARWPDNNRRVLSEVAAGAQRWEGGGLRPETLELLRSFDYTQMTQASGAALLWYVRNVLFFDHGLDSRDDVVLVSYERFLAEPERSMRSVCEFVGIGFHPRMVDRMAPRPPATTGTLEIDPTILELCSDLERRLDAAARAQLPF